MLYAREVQVVLARAALFLTFAALPALASDAGQLAAGEVSQASYVDFLDHYLFTHDGDDRGPWGPELGLCRDNLVTFFQSYGLSVQLEPFIWNGSTYHNVVATKLGTVDPTREYIIGAHYDSVGNPGADDNASGTALVLEAARVLSQYDSAYTLRFVGFSMEEQGLIGSYAYVNDHWADDIRGMVSADMVAYNLGDDAVSVYGRTESDPLKFTVADAISEYGNGLIPLLGGDLPGSDHAPFEQAGFQACLVIEDNYSTNPNYHEPGDSFDTPKYLNFSYATRITRSLVGWLVDAAQVEVDRIEFDYPAGRPAFAAPSGGTTIPVQVASYGSVQLEPNTVTLHFDDGTGWQTMPLPSPGADEYDLTFPATTCGNVLTYYLSAVGSDAATYTSPFGAPASTYTITAAYGEEVFFTDDFEVDAGWTVQNVDLQRGAWERGVPAGDGVRGDPTFDDDGSGACYLTGNAVGDTDVDGGPTQLISPAFDLSTSAGHQISYSAWLATAAGTPDDLVVEVSNDDGTSWVPVTSHGVTDGWLPAQFALSDYVAPTATVRVRYSVADSPNNSVTEAGLDAFRIIQAQCGVLLGDMNCDGQVDFADINPLVLALTNPPGYAQQFPTCDPLNGDFSGDDSLGFEDINGFVSTLTSD